MLARLNLLFNVPHTQEHELDLVLAIRFRSPYCKYPYLYFKFRRDTFFYTLLQTGFDNDIQ